MFRGKLHSQRNVCLHKSAFFVCENCFCPLQMQYIEEPFAVYDLGGKGARQEYGVIAHSIQEGSDFIIMVHHVGGDSPPVYGVDRIAGR